MEYFRRRPPGWREDNRAAVISICTASSFGGAKIKPEDLFDSLRIVQEDIQSSSKNKETLGQKFFDRFASRMTEEITFDVQYQTTK